MWMETLLLYAYLKLPWIQMNASILCASSHIVARYFDTSATEITAGKTGANFLVEHTWGLVHFENGSVYMWHVLCCMGHFSINLPLDARCARCSHLPMCLKCWPPLPLYRASLMLLPKKVVIWTCWLIVLNFWQCTRKRWLSLCTLYC